MDPHMHNFREIRIQPPGPLGCLGLALGLGVLVVLAAVLLLPLLGIAVGVGLGIAGFGMLVAAWWRLRAWWRRRVSRRRGEPATCEARSVEEDDDDTPRPTGRPAQRRLSVEVRRRPHVD